MADRREADAGAQKGGAFVMAVVVVWCTVLAVGFGWGAVTAPDRLGAGRTALFAALALLLGVAALRTLIELIRRVRGR